MVDLGWAGAVAARRSTGGGGNDMRSLVLSCVALYSTKTWRGMADVTMRGRLFGPR